LETRKSLDYTTFIRVATGLIPVGYMNNSIDFSQDQLQQLQSYFKKYLGVLLLTSSKGTYILVNIKAVTAVIEENSALFPSGLASSPTRTIEQEIAKIMFAAKMTPELINLTSLLEGFPVIPHQQSHLETVLRNSVATEVSPETERPTIDELITILNQTQKVTPRTQAEKDTLRREMEKYKSLIPWIDQSLISTRMTTKWYGAQYVTEDQRKEIEYMSDSISELWMDGLPHKRSFQRM